MNVLLSAHVPALAWCAKIQKAATVVVKVGKAVEVQGKAFVEGAWSGNFSKLDFANSLTFCGSGLKIQGDTVLLAGSTDTLSPLYVKREHSGVWVSNSLSFLLSETGARLSPRYPFYDSDLMTVIFGLRHYVRKIPVEPSGVVSIVHHANLIVDRELKVTRVPKHDPPFFKSYSEYRGYLDEEIRSVFSNASDPVRKILYEPLTTVSTGYDSPACAVLGQTAGCRNALTIRDRKKEENDSGTEIARVLGLSCVEVESRPETLSPSTIAEFGSAGTGGDDAVFGSAEHLLSGKIVLTGYHGDKVWDPNSHSVSSEIIRGDPSGGSLQEFRLRVGFLNLPVPFMGSISHPSIHRISNSLEMDVWRIGGPYDRPIPRRIVEEAGVNRECFGQTKKVVARPYQTTGDSNPELDVLYSNDVITDFEDYIHRNSIELPLITRVFEKPIGKIANSTKVNRMSKRLGMEAQAERLRWRYRKPFSEHCFFIHWAVDKQINAYHDAKC